MKIGDVVSLPSGSAKMTVYATRDKLVDVCWMGYDDHLMHRDTLPKDILVINGGASASATPPWKPGEAK